MRQGRLDAFDRDDHERRLRAAIQERESDPKAAMAVGVTAQTILRFRKRHGIPPKIPQMGSHEYPNERPTR